MKIVLDLALSSDGYIAKKDGDSSWVSERTEDLFKQRIREAGCLVVGKKTFDQYRDVIYPVEGAINIVLTRKSHLEHTAGVIYVSAPEEAIKVAKEYKCDGILIAGGSAVSKAFLEKGLIDEIYLSIHPITLGEGMRPFADMETPSNLTVLDTQDLGDGIRQNHYRIER